MRHLGEDKEALASKFKWPLSPVCRLFVPRDISIQLLICPVACFKVERTHIPEEQRSSRTGNSPGLFCHCDHRRGGGRMLLPDDLSEATLVLEQHETGMIVKEACTE